MDKFKLMWNLARSKAYVVLTDRRSVISIPLLDPNRINDLMILSAQTSSLQEFHARLGELVKDHENKVAMLQNRASSKLFKKAKVGVSKGKK